MDLSALEWLELQSRKKVIDFPINEPLPSKDKPAKREIKTTIVEVWKQNLPNYIDPNTGLPYDPFRVNGERGRRLDQLRKLRAVLP
jgi:hypothetical protein